MAISSRITLLGALALWAFQAQAVDVTVAYQTSAEPAKVAQADNTFAKASGANVDWRKFDSGAAIVRALASGDVQIGNLGSSPLAVAASQQVPIEVFLLASQLGNSEALVVKKSITKPEDLIGKRIAVPFISTTHYSLLAALKHWGIKPGQVQIINLQPPAIIAAWQRGDIDGAYVWAPAVNELEKEGTVLTDSAVMYQSRVEELNQMHGAYNAHEAALDHNLHMLGLKTDSMLELTYTERKRVHNLKYYTWVEQQQMNVEDLNAQWYDTKNTWDAVHAQAKELDELINEFNEATGLLKAL